MPLALVNKAIRSLWTISSTAPGPQHGRRRVLRRQTVSTVVAGQFPDDNLSFAFSPSDLRRISKRVPSLARSSPPESSDDGAGSCGGISWAARASVQAAILAREGLPPQEAAAIFASYPELLVARHLEANLAFFRHLLSGGQQQGAEQQDADGCRPGEPPSLTPLGRLLRAQPAAMGRALAAQPSSHESLLRWYSTRLEVSPRALAEAFPACPALFQVSAAGAEACVSHLTSGLGLPLATARRMVLAYPPTLKLTAAAVDSKLAQLCRHLGLDHKGALEFVARHPRALGTDLAARLPPLLAALQELFAPELDPAALLVDSPLLISVTPETLCQNARMLLQAGYSEGHIAQICMRYPALFNKALAGPVQQQAGAAPRKLQWLREVAALSLDDVAEDPRLLSYSLRRLASRHAFACEHGLLVRVQQLARDREEAWLRRAGASREQWQAWEAGWLASEQGRRWGWSSGRCPAARRQSAEL